MRVISSAFQTAMNSGFINTVILLRVNRPDGVVIALTNHDQTVTFAGIDYLPNEGLDPTAITSMAEGATSNINIETLAADNVDLFDPKHIAGGLFYGSKTELYYYDIGSSFSILLQTGVIGEIEIRNGMAVNLEIKGLASRAREKGLVELYSTTDRAILGDTRNGLDVSAFTFFGEVTSVDVVNNKSIFTVSISAFTTEGGYFNNGLCVFLTGNNHVPSLGPDYYAREIRVQTTANTLFLFEETPFPISAGVEVKLISGYNGTLEQARDKFDNVINFRGEPFIPGIDNVTRQGDI